MLPDFSQIKEQDLMKIWGLKLKRMKIDWAFFLSRLFEQ